MAPSFLITGATGQQGGATTRILLKNNVTVHVLVHNPNSDAAQSLEKAGAVLFKGDFDDIAAINDATAGVTGVFLNPQLAKDPGHEVHQAQHFITAALAAKSVTTLVVSTAFFTADREKWDIDDGLRAYYNSKGAIEDAVRTAGFQNYTILRPAWLMHNYFLPQSRYHFPELGTQGVLAHSYNPESRMPHFDPEDVGQFAAAALLNPAKFNGHEIELGNENLTAVEMARILSEASGVDVVERKRLDEESALLGKEIPTMIFHLLANRNDIDIDGEKLQRDYGVRLTSFGEYLRRERGALLESLPSRK